MESESMGWTTVYVRGRSGFEGEVTKNLDDSGFLCMPGYSNEKGLTLFWIHEQETLRSFKKAIGAKTVLKYRLKFFTNVEDFVETKYNARNQPFSNEDLVNLITQMNARLESPSA